MQQRPPPFLLLLLALAVLLALLAGHGADAAITPASVKAVMQMCQGKPDQKEEHRTDQQGFADCVARRLYDREVKLLLTQIMDGLEARREAEAEYGAHVCREGTGSAEPLASETWEWAGHGPVRVDKLFESPRGQAAVYLAHDFISTAECSELRYRAGEFSGLFGEAGEYGAHDRKPSQSANRKARAATLKPNPHDLKDPISKLQARVFALANAFRPNASIILPPLSPFGQEPFNVIDYSRIGDEYKIHCDTHCDGTSLIPHGRVATVVIYCAEPTRGGATTFPFIDISVQGRGGQALLFWYNGDPGAAPPDASSWRAGGVTDNGFTSHTGCPVLEGKKVIATQWMRVGVTEQDPWSRYSSVGVALTR